MGGWAGAGLGLLKGYDRAAGANDAANDVAAEQNQRNQKVIQDRQQQIAPLSQALQAGQTRLSLYADPNDPSKAAPGKESEYAAQHDQMADIIGKMRTILHPPPSDDPHGLKYLASRATDKLHITNHLSDHVRQEQEDKARAVSESGRAQDYQGATTAAEGIPYNPLTPDQQAEAARIKAGIVPKAVADKAPTATSDTRARADFDAFKKDNPQYKGSFEQWKTEQAGAGRNAVKQPGRDDKYIAIEQKKASGTPLTPEDKAYSTAYDIWTKKTKVDPGVARANAFAANRFVPVVGMDSSDPGKVTLMRAGEAAKSGAGTPASIGFQTDKAITKYMTSGAGAANINAFNTASDHLRILKEAGDALNNGDTQKFNEWGNKYATATGSAAPTNFETVKAAVAGELSKTFKGAGATDAEIGQINATINSSESPAQIQGAIDYYTRLMDSKLEALKGQYEAGKEGKPNFQGPKTKQLQSSTTGGQSKGTVSIVAAMKKDKYKGKSKKEVSDAITAAGYTPVD